MLLVMLLVGHLFEIDERSLQQQGRGAGLQWLAGEFMQDDPGKATADDALQFRLLIDRIATLKWAVEATVLLLLDCKENGDSHAWRDEPGRLELFGKGHDGSHQPTGMRVGRPQGEVLEQRRTTDLAEAVILLGQHDFLHG
ncbi:hypothetical protein D3C79_805630 [compost metagenome]